MATLRLNNRRLDALKPRKFACNIRDRATTDPKNTPNPANPQHS